MKRFAALVVALFSAAVFAQDLPKIAVYVTGDVADNEKKTLGTRMLASLVNSGRYMGIERSNSFLAEIEKEQVKQRSGAIDDSQISELGRQFGVKFVCIADITPAFGAFQVSARIVNVETAVVAFIGEATSSLKNMDDMNAVSDEVVRIMFGGRADGAKLNNNHVLTSGIDTPKKKRGSYYYFAPKYQFPIWTPISWGGIDLDMGWNGIWWGGRNVELGNVFWGLDFTFGYDSRPKFENISDNIAQRNLDMVVGLGLVLGNVYDLGNRLSFVYGGVVV